MRKRLKNSVVPYLYLSPVLIGLSVFTIGPILSSFFLSFTNYELGLKAEWIGGANYAKLADSEVFLQSVKNTLVYVILYVPLAVIFSFALAMLVNGKLRGRAFFRTVFFLPVVTSMVAAALIWGWLYHPDVGLLNYVLSTLGIVGPRWLEDPDTALSALVIVGVWKNAGYNMLIFLAGLSGISNEVIEAAKLEGASVWKRIRYVLVPMLMPVIFFVTVITTISAFQIFEQTYVLTKGGPANSTLTLSYYIWQMAFQFFDMGQASAMAYVLFAILAILTAVQFQVRKRAAA
jgi:multiple sugar transport system permease protein